MRSNEDNVHNCYYCGKFRADVRMYYAPVSDLPLSYNIQAFCDAPCWRKAEERAKKCEDQEQPRSLWRLIPFDARRRRNSVKTRYGLGTANDAAEYIAKIFQHGGIAEECKSCSEEWVIPNGHALDLAIELTTS